MNSFQNYYLKIFVISAIKLMAHIHRHICANTPNRHSFCVIKLAKYFFRSTPFGHVFSQSLYLILYEETVEQAKTGL